MAYDAVTTAAVAAELRERVRGGRVDKVLQPSDHAVALLVRAGGANHWLLLSAHPRHARVAISAARMAKAYDEPSPFVMLLRKHVEGAHLASIEQAGHDRVLRLTFQSHLTGVTLIAEVMGKHSNIILVDSQDTILGAVKLISPALSRYRVVAPHRPYIAPPIPIQPPPHEGVPKLDPFAIAPTDLARCLADLPDETSLAGALVGALSGVSPQLAREVAYRLAGTVDERLGHARGQIATALDLVRELAAPAEWRPSIARRDGEILGWAAYALCQHGIHPELFSSISSVIDEVYAGLESDDALSPVRARLRAAICRYHDRSTAKAASLRAGIRAPEAIERLREQGEMILAFAHELAPAQRELRLPEGASTAISSIELDPALSPAENAQSYFTRYRKARDAASRVPPLLEETERDIEFLEAALLYVEQAESAQALIEIKDDLVAAGVSLPGEKAGTRSPKEKGGKYHPGGKQPPKRHPASPLRYLTSDGLAVLVGRSAGQNEVVTFELASGGDLWFHARGLPGSHVVLKTGGRTPPETSLQQAAELAAFYSRGRGSTTLQVDVVPARAVRHVKGGKPGLVRISGETTLNVRPRIGCQPAGAAA